MRGVLERLRRLAPSGRERSEGDAGGDGPASAGGDSAAAATDEGEPLLTDGSGEAGQAAESTGQVGAASASVDRYRSAIEEKFGQDFVESSPFWLPPFLLVVLFVYGAILWNLLISLTDYSGFGEPDYTDLDLEMYVQAFSDQTFVNASVNTFLLVVGFTLGTLAVGLVLAILIDRGIRMENTIRTVYLLPMSLSFVVTAQFWKWLYNYNNGLVNEVLVWTGIGRIHWIGNQDVVLWAVVLALLWQFSGYAMVVYLAGLRAIPGEIYEAARVDGASTLRMYWRVIVPQLKGATISASVVLMVFALKAFDFLYAFASGYRPPPGSDILATLMVREAYSNNNWAYGAAVAIMLFALALSVIGPYLVYQYRRGNL